PRGVAKQIALRSEFLMMEELSTNLFEADLARIVDFGHTFSPAIESHSSFRIPHGAAVAIDMLLSTAIAVTRSLAEPALLHRLVGLTRDLGLLPTSEELPEPDFLQAALDEARQHRGGALNLVVVQRVAHPMFLQELRQSDLRSARRLLVSYLKSHDTKFAWHQDECVNF
ncbi:MAG: hypothetical protein JO061_07855, partial [Acidobacteriaceae bacterium]|nr:hypothetical protein [Acidobacteriaceae bacterium]